MNAPAVFPTHSRSRGAHAADTPPGHAPAAPPSLIAAPCPPSPVLEELRSLLAERFQHALPAAQPPPAPVPLPTGLPAWDAQTGGIRPGEITEICGGLAATHLVLEGVLESFFRAGWLGAWVDAGNSLDVRVVPPPPSAPAVGALPQRTDGRQGGRPSVARRQLLLGPA